MHGTFVNGLSLKADETAELQQGTEVTFGSEVARGEEIFPPKTFRCEVEWEEIALSKPRYVVDNGRTSGYGVSSQALLMSDDDEDFEDEQYEDETTFGDIHPSDHERRSTSSGTESSPSNSASTSPPNKETKSTHVGTSPSKTPFTHDNDIPVSHERSTKDLSVQSLTKNEFEQRLESLKKQITDQMRKSKENTNTQVDLVDLEVDENQARPRLTIGSLMNKSQEPSTSQTNESKMSATKKRRSKNKYDNLFLEDDEASTGEEDDLVEVIPRPAKFNDRSSKKSTKNREAIVIEDDDDDINMHEESDNEDHEGIMQNHAVSSFGRLFPHLEADKENTVSSSTPKESNRNKTADTDANSQIPDSQSEPPEVTSSKTLMSPFMPPLNVQSTKTEQVSRFEQLAKAADSIRKSPTPVAPTNSLPPLPMPPVITTRTACGASHIHWLPEKPLPDYGHNPQVFCSFNDVSASALALPLPYTGGMDQKKEFFAAREHNSALFDSQRYQDASHDNMDSIASSSKPSQHPYSIGLTAKRLETPKEVAAGLFPKVKSFPEDDKDSRISSAKINKTRDIPSQSLNTSVKPRVEDSVPEITKEKGGSYKDLWGNGNEDEGAEIDDNVDSMWDEGLNDEDGEYDEEDGNDGLEMEIDHEYSEEEEEEEEEVEEEEEGENEEQEEEEEEEEDDEEEADGMDHQTDEIRTDVRDYGSNCTSIDRTNDESYRVPTYHFSTTSSNIITANPVPLVRTSVSEADKDDFTKSRGFSISNLVHENAGPQTDQLAQAASNGYYFEETDEVIPGPSCRFWRPYESPLVSFPGIKDNSVTDLLNPSPVGTKRKFEDISTTTEEEETVNAIKDSIAAAYAMAETDEPAHDTQEQGQHEPLQDAQGIDGQASIEPISEKSESFDTMATESSEGTITATNAQVISAPEAIAHSNGESANAQDERPTKKARRNGPVSGFARYAASALAGVVVGGVGVFAALVATAPAS
ncbi:hypothetical protein RUND412_003748 [Rhizina undulata]